ncbi:MAG: phosphodiester glycosidase family protein [Candidatus Aminicenantes bacterium]|nr:phosphodiester glycosidase family protein [Candidatus Aminicenantes bacterium]NLH75842.1 phosphodiester glycosidase family protein [Acidobacteriota bacterium]
MAISKAGTFVVAFLLSAVGSAAPAADWKAVCPGVEYTVLDLGTQVEFGDNRLHVVRIDPARARLAAVFAGRADGQARTAGEWCRERGLAVSINLGMFRMDHRTNVGYARDGAYLNNGTWSPTYKSALAFGPKENDVPPAVMVDLDDPDSEYALGEYDSVIQNLRLIKGPGKSVWSVQAKRWSEAAVACDGDGRILFLFSRSPFPMGEFNRIVLGLRLGIVRAMHVEGGPEASLSIHGGGVDLDLCGSFETGFVPDDGNTAQWPIPNVLGVLKAPGD